MEGGYTGRLLIGETQLTEPQGKIKNRYLLNDEQMRPFMFL